MSSDSPPGTILIADDNRVNRLLLSRGLEQQGHTVVFAENGREALDLLRQNGFDLLLLDVLMPELDGYEVLAELQRDPHLRDLPVVVTSALDELESVVKCVEMGAEDYLTKPINPVLLNDYYTLMMDAISGEGGIVNQMVGDGLMAIFGAPLPREDHRERAVAAARQMIELIRLFNEEQATRDKIQIQIGIGIGSGQLVAGYTGTLHRATYTCVGDAVNVAARLESETKALNRPILIDDHTRLGLGDGIAVEEQGELPVKGKTKPVKVYSVDVDPVVAESA